MTFSRELKAKAFVLTGFFAIGIIAGACHALISSNSLNVTKYNVGRLTENLRYAEVQEGRLQCVVLTDGAELFNKPSALTGTVIDRMSKGVKVDYVETVSGMDKEDDQAVTTVELQFQRLWGRRYVIPAGSKVQILRRGEEETKGRVLVDGKYFDKDFDNAYLRFPYVGQWRKVEFQGKPGYMRFDALSEEGLM